MFVVTSGSKAFVGISVELPWRDRQYVGSGRLDFGEMEYYIRSIGSAISQCIVYSDIVAEKYQQIFTYEKSNCSKTLTNDNVISIPSYSPTGTWR